jgi:hypothetical protein
MPRTRAERRTVLSKRIVESSKGDMPSCSSCRKAGAVCHLAPSLHKDCARCIRAGRACDATFDELECRWICFLMFVVFC